MRKSLLAIFSFILLLASANSHAGSHFNILLYHHVHAETPPSTSVTPEEFDNHMAFLHANNYQVISLQQGLEAIQNNRPLPEKSVVITFDDAWRNIYTNAVPIMEKYGFNYTIFINTDFVDEKHRSGMTWDMLRDIKKRGGTLANHTSDHDYLVRNTQQDKQWLSKAISNIEHAQTRLETETGTTPKWLAYPYGEYNHALKQAVKDLGYIAFGQHSGGIGPFSDWQALPRFPAAGIYSDINKLKVKLNSQPLPVNYQNLPDMLIINNPISTANVTTLPNPPGLQAELLQPLSANSKAQFNCFILGQAVKPIWLDESTWYVSAETKLPLERSRYNCTAPVAGQSNYYWFSQQWIVQD